MVDSLHSLLIANYPNRDASQKARWLAGLATFPGRAALSVYISYSQSRSFGLSVAARHRQSLGLTIYDRSPALDLQTYSTQATLLLCQVSGTRQAGGETGVRSHLSLPRLSSSERY